MTNRYRQILITLDKEMREDDIEVVVSALRMIKRVDRVKLVDQDWQTDLAAQQAKSDMRKKIFALFEELMKD